MMLLDSARKSVFFQLDTIPVKHRGVVRGAILFKEIIAMKVLLVAPNTEPRAVEIDGSLASMQSLVGGLIEAVYPFSDPVALICNDEGKLTGLP